MRRLAAFALVALLAGCQVGPNYARPDTNVPSTYRGASAAGPQSLGDLKWAELIRDPVLQSLLVEALVKNFDVRVAVQRVLEARAQLAAAHAAQFPTLTASGGIGYSRIPPTLSNPNSSYSNWARNLGAQLNYEADLWGQLSRNAQSANAYLLATESGQKAVLTTVVSSVANAYLFLRALDLELQIAKDTLVARQASLRLVQSRLDYGIGTKQDVDQAASLVYTVTSDIPNIERQIEQTENALSILLGRNPGPIPRGLTLVDQFNLPAAPAGVPGTLLERRPDIQAAEQMLVAANAQIGANMANLLPNLTISGVGYGVNTQLGGGTLLTPVNSTLGIFSLAATLGQLIFDAGRARAGVALAQSQTQEAVVVYQHTVTQSVREVSDALVDYRQYIDIVAEQKKLTDALHDSVRQANLRFEGGVTSYLEVLNAQTQAYTADINLAQAELAQRNAVVNLYKALGGGWQ
ncbi:MAG: efflux transporter outer membrane subunit [Candidatus Eremiobacteraeota bacterium]|nr:efflux transporter outer membrane subunit [Candidatus Eremiobacteraeota bacterium]